MTGSSAMTGFKLIATAFAAMTGSLIHAIVAHADAADGKMVRHGYRAYVSTTPRPGTPTKDGDRYGM